MITIRPAILTDAPAIARVHVDSWRSTYQGIVSDEFLASLSYERREKNWAGMLSAPGTDSSICVAVTGTGDVVGFASFGPGRDSDAEYRGELYAIYILKQAQGQGARRGLFEVTVRELVERGYGSMMLWVLKDNTPARKFYEAMGGQYVREKPIEIGNQTLIEVAYGWQDLRAHLKE